MLCALLSAGGVVLWHKKDWSREDAHGRAHPITVVTLAGDRYTVAGWGAAWHLGKAIVSEHPELGRPDTFLLQDKQGIPVNAGGRAPAAWLTCADPIELILVYITGADHPVADDARLLNYADTTADTVV